MFATLSTITIAALLLVSSPSSSVAQPHHNHAEVKRSSHAVLARGLGGMEAMEGGNLEDRSLGSRIGGETLNKRTIPFGKRSQVAGAAQLSISKNLTASTVYNSTAMWYVNANTESACLTYNNDTEYVIGLPLALWANTTIPSNLCGQAVVVTNLDNGKSITAIVGDASGKIGYTSLSQSAFGAISKLSAGIFSMSFSFVNGSAVALANSTTAVYNNSLVATALELTIPGLLIPSPTVGEAAASTITPAMVLGLSVSGTENQALAKIAAASEASVNSVVSVASASSASVASASASASAEAAASASASASASAAAASASAAADQAWQASQAQAAAASSSAAAAWEASSSSSAAAAAATPSQNSGGQTYSGDATFFYQNGVAGACGVVHPDSFYGIAIDSEMYDGGSNCWRYIQITNSATGATVTAQVVDECPTCNSGTSLDLSVGAFNAIASESQGLVAMTWKFV